MLFRLYKNIYVYIRFEIAYIVHVFEMMLYCKWKITVICIMGYVLDVSETWKCCK